MPATQEKVIRTAKAVLATLRKEGERLESVLADYKETPITKRNGDGRFQSSAILPVLKKIRGKFTINELEARCLNAGLVGTRQQISSALYRYKGGIVKTVIHGYGHQEAVYEVDHKAIK